MHSTNKGLAQLDVGSAALLDIRTVMILDGSSAHEVEDLTGDRISIVFFTVRNLYRVADDEAESLLRMGIGALQCRA